MKRVPKFYFKALSLLVVCCLIFLAAPTSTVKAAGSNSVYCQLASDRYITTPTAILTTTVYLPYSQQVYLQSDGRIYPGGTEDCARMRIYVDNSPVGSDSLIDWRSSNNDAQHSYNCIAALWLSAGNHTVTLMAIPLYGSFSVGAKSNLSVMTGITVNMQSVRTTADVGEFNFTTYGIAPPNPVPHTPILSINVNNTSGPIIALGSGRAYYTNGGDMMLGIYKNGIALPTDQGVWSVNDGYDGCERQAPMYNHAYMNAVGNQTITLDASEIPWPVDNQNLGENPARFYVGADTTLVVLNGEMAVRGSAPQSTAVNDCWNWRNIGTGTGEAVAIASSIVNIPYGHNGVVMFQAKTRFQGDISDYGGNGFLWLNIDGVDVGSVGVQGIINGAGNSQRTACASYLSAGSNALTPGNHVVTVYAKAQGSFAHLCTSTDVPLIWFDGQSGSPTVGSNLLSNPGFENGLTSWSGYNNAYIQLNSQHKVGGNYSCRVYNRTGPNSLAYQDIRSLLLSRGQGGYSISGWAKLASGSDNAFIEVYITDSSGGHRHIVPSTTLTSSSFSKVEGTMNITWSGTLQSASFYLITQTSTSDLYLDDFSMSKY